MRNIVIIAALSACGSVPAIDVDAAPDAVGWSKPELLASTGFDASGPSLSDDGLALYFASAGPSGASVIYRSSRSSSSRSFGPAGIVEIDSDGSGVADPEMSSTGLELYYSVVWIDNGIEKRILAVSLRQSLTAAWGAPIMIGLGHSPSLTADGLSFFFVVDDAVKSMRRPSADQPWTDEKYVIRGKYNDADISPDGLSIVLVSDGAVMIGRRETTGDAFALDGHPIAETVNSAAWGIDDSEILLGMKNGEQFDLYMTKKL